MNTLDWRHPLYRRWKSMLQASQTKKMNKWRELGDKMGFYVPNVCERWQGRSYEDDGFKNFASDVGNPPKENSIIARIDYTKDWGPNNFYWSTKKELFLLNKTRVIGWRAWVPPEIVEEFDRKMDEDALRIAESIKI